MQNILNIEYLFRKIEFSRIHDFDLIGNVSCVNGGLLFVGHRSVERPVRSERTLRSLGPGSTIRLSN